MKRRGNLFGPAFSHENLYQGYLDARRNKRGSRSCYEFERSLGARMADLHRTLHDGSYVPQPYNTFMVQQPKQRLISAPSFRDRVAQHAIYRVIQPIFDKTFISQSFACRPGYGTHAASDYVQQALRLAPRGSYTLQLDIRRFYYSIYRTILRALIEHRVKDARLIDVMMRFAEQGEPVGLPIGNLLSQLYALIYLNPLDHYIKRELNIERYVRYVDDLVLIGLDRDQAVECRAKIGAFLADRLRLAFSKTSIARVTRGVNFVGYRTWSSRRFVRKRALYTFRRASRRGRLESIVSSLGHARRTASFLHMIRYLETHHHGLYRQLPERLGCLHHVPARAA